MPSNTDPTLPSTNPKNDDIQLNVDVTNVLEKINVHVPLSEWIKIPSQMDKVRKFLTPKPEDPPNVLQTADYRRDNREHPPFFITLVVNNLLLHNCMIAYGASINVMLLKVVNELGLETTRAYRNVCRIDSKAIKVCGMIT